MDELLNVALYLVEDCKGIKYSIPIQIFPHTKVLENGMQFDPDKFFDRLGESIQFQEAVSDAASLINKDSLVVISCDRVSGKIELRRPNNKNFQDGKLELITIKTYGEVILW